MWISGIAECVGSVGFAHYESPFLTRMLILGGLGGSDFFRTEIMSFSYVHTGCGGFSGRLLR